MGSAPIPIFTFSPNPNNYYTSKNDTTILLINNIQLGFVLCFQITSLLLIGNLLLFVPIFRRISVKISAMLKLYLSFHALFLFVQLAYYFQKAFALFDPRTNFDIVIWIYNISEPYAYIQPYLSLMLTVERILIIRFPISFMHYRKHYIRGAAFLTPLVYFLAIIWDILEIPLDPKIAFRAPPLIYTSPTFHYIPQSTLKLIFGGLDICASAFFFMCLNKQMNKKIKNRVVKFTVICEILMEVLPAFILQLKNLANLTPATWNQHANVISNLLATMNLTLCVLYYNWIFLIVGPRQIVGAQALGQVKIIAIKSANNIGNGT